MIAPASFIRHPVEEERLTTFLWEQGKLRFLLWPSQRRAYDFIHGWKGAHPNSALPIVLNCHRGFGKSTLCLVLLFERALRCPGQALRYGTGTIKDTEAIVGPIIQKLLEECPEHLRPLRRGDQLIFRNPRWPPGSRPSLVYVIGCQERADRHRGKRSHAVAIDEARNVEAFEYVATSVFGPHFVRQEDPLYLMISTPPETMDHAWSRKFVPEAQADGRYLEIPVTENEDWTERDDLRMLELFREKASAEWRREMLCHLISDPERLIVPEFDEAQHTRPTYPRPSHFIPLVGADGGFVDFFASLFGFIDFRSQPPTLVIEDSIVVKRKNTGEMAQLIKAKEEELFTRLEADGTRVPLQPAHNTRRHADMTPREVEDLNSIYKLKFSPAETHDVDSQIAHLRTNVHNRKILILTGTCGTKNRALIAQLKNAIRDEKGKIPRSEEHGHYDALMALVYLNRQAPWNLNPFPKGVEINDQTQAPGRNIRLAQRERPQKTGMSRSTLRGMLRPRRLR